MNPVLAQWLPTIFMVLAIWVGLIYNNKRLDDFKDLLRAEVGKVRSDVHAEIIEVHAGLHDEISESEKRILLAIADLKGDLKADIQTLDRRVQRLETPLLRG